MTNYRRNFLDAGSYFFTVNLAERRSRLLTDHIGLLCAAFRYTRARHPFVRLGIYPTDWSGATKTMVVRLGSRDGYRYAQPILRETF